MKKSCSKIIFGTLLATSLLACSKVDKSEAASSEISSKSAAADLVVADSVSYVASQNIPDKKFVKTADINMEVKDVYDATVFIENQLKNFGGFVTVSRLNSNVISEDTFETSDSEAVLVKRYQAESTMQVRVPSEHLGEFLNAINDKKAFLNSRVILAEDVTDNDRISQLEQQKLKQTGAVIAKLKNNGEKVEKTEQNFSAINEDMIRNMKLADHLRYAMVEIYIKEPNTRIAEIAVANAGNMDNKYKFNFFYDAKNAFVEGFYLVQKFLVLLVHIWPILLSGALFLFFYRKRKVVKPVLPNDPASNL